MVRAPTAAPGIFLSSRPALSSVSEFLLRSKFRNCLLNPEQTLLSESFLIRDGGQKLLLLPYDIFGPPPSFSSATLFSSLLSITCGPPLWKTRLPRCQHHKYWVVDLIKHQQTPREPWRKRLPLPEVEGRNYILHTRQLQNRSNSSEPS